jgi:hypothetical protein
VKDLFRAISRHYGRQQMKETGHEMHLGEQAKQEAKPMLYRISEFLARLAFLLLFGQCKK